jgi:hypothetical protein
MNPKHYNKTFQAFAWDWWSTLSINEMKAFEKKHGIIFDMALPSEIARIYDLEVNQETKVIATGERLMSHFEETHAKL